ncbi:MAG: ArnT family glycosyltransferase [Candidatus Aenigmatarchaeota archaeon]
MKSKNIILFFVISIFAIIQFSLVFINKGLWWDEAIYLGLAENIRSGFYSLSLSSPVEAFRAPLFPLLSSILGANPVNVVFSRLIPFLFYSLSIITIYKVGRKMFSSKEMGLVTGLLITSLPLFIFYSNKFLSESLFVLIFTSSLYLFELNMKEENGKFAFLLGISLGLSFLTRYIGIILVPLYIIWFTYKEKFRKCFFILLGFFTALTPWIIHQHMLFGNPLWGFLSNFKIYTTMTSKSFLYYIVNSYDIFGPLTIVIFFGYLVSLKDLFFQNLKGNEKFILILSLFIPFILTIMGNKNIRYLVSFYPIFCLLAALTLFRVKRYGTKVYNFLIVLIVLLSIGSFYAGYDRVLKDRDSGLALKEAGLYVKENTGNEEIIMTQIYSSHYPEWNISSNNPWIRVIGGRKTIPFPENKDDLKETIKKYDIKYVLVYNFGPIVPEYSKEIIENKEFVEIKTFNQWNYEKAAVIYKYQP